MIKAIIPCAGFGTRMGMDPNKSKELLIDPTTNRPMIEYHLDICKTYNLVPHIILRQEKVDLIEYCDNNNIMCSSVSHNREWPYTVFLSHGKWAYKNILLLPDSKFEPTNIVDNIVNDLRLGAEVSLGVHEVQDPEKWCIVRDYELIEKSKQVVGKQWAFGVIGFTYGAGLKLFAELDQEKRARLLNRTSIQYLDSFKDITRTGIVSG
jgi:dTDP-glucose pyrophosphorylase